MMNRTGSKLPLSLYVHIPFCIKKCLYCDFLSANASEEVKNAYIGALVEELDYWGDRIFGKYYIKTVFIGGGTPTCLSPRQLLRIGEKLCEIISSDEMPFLEFTVEANPGTITLSHIEVMKELGVNRVSLGLQSAQDRELRELGRIHSFQDFVKSYEMLRNYDFQNINVDLMADIPGQTLASYHSTLEQVLALRPEHISSYSLIVEEGTPFFQLQEEGKLSVPDEDTDREMYELTLAMLEGEGYQRDEISNYASDGKKCLHNLTYWKMEEYLGLGLGASSYLEGYRFKNVSDMEGYLRKQGDKRESKGHKLSKKEEMEEYVFLGLRMAEGISLSDYKKRFGMDFKTIYAKTLDSMIKKCLLAESGNHDRIYLTSRGIDVSNVVLAEFLLD